MKCHHRNLYNRSWKTKLYWDGDPHPFKVGDNTCEHFRGNEIYLTLSWGSTTTFNFIFFGSSNSHYCFFRNKEFINNDGVILHHFTSPTFNHNKRWRLFWWTLFCKPCWISVSLSVISPTYKNKKSLINLVTKRKTNKQVVYFAKQLDNIF